MKKQKVSLKKLQLSKSKVSNLTTNQVVGGSFFCHTNGCLITEGCPITIGCTSPSDDCPAPTTDCPSINCLTIDCVTLAAGCTTSPTLACW